MTGMLLKPKLFEDWIAHLSRSAVYVSPRRHFETSNLSILTCLHKVLKQLLDICFILSLAMMTLTKWYDFVTSRAKNTNNFWAACFYLVLTVFVCWQHSITKRLVDLVKVLPSAFDRVHSQSANRMVCRRQIRRQSRNLIQARTDQ